MNLEAVITDYIAHQRSLGKRFRREATTLAGFGRSVGDIPIEDVRPEMILRFVDRDGTGYETRSKKYRALSYLFLFAVTRHHLRTSPMPKRLRRRAYSAYVPYIYSEV